MRTRLYSADNAQYEDVTLPAAAHADAVIQCDGGRGRYYGRYLLSNRIDIFHGHGVGGGIDALGSTLIVGVNHIGADGLNLAQDVLLAGESDGDHQNHRGRSHRHRQRGQA